MILQLLSGLFITGLGVILAIGAFLPPTKPLRTVQFPLSFTDPETGREFMLLRRNSDRTFLVTEVTKIKEAAE